MKQFRWDNLGKDILSGIVVALVSIPIGMGYSQIAGLPVEYGLYGSLLPILIYALTTTSPQFVFGVDATPAALVGGLLASLGIASGSKEAMELVPVITSVVAIWLFILYLCKAGRLVNYISKPVMGGFITGIGCTIILMQIPKLFGGSPGTGELFILLYNIGKEMIHFNIASAVLGFGTIAVILIMKKVAPKIPMSVLMMGIGALLTVMLPLEQWGVKLLPTVTNGLPRLIIPRFNLILIEPGEIITLSLTIALVIVAQTLLATSNYAMKNQYKIDNNREILAYSLGNVAGALVGSCPINGSVSRTGMAEQYGCKSQVMSLASSGTIALVLLFGTGLLHYLPVPVLTGIVMTALIGILEHKMATRLWKADKHEFAIFMAAFWGVLLFGTLYGVIIGVILSFIAVIRRAVVPPKAFLGMIPGHEEFYNLSRNRDAKALEHTVIYRFSGNLFFANINTFQKDIEDAIKEDTRQVIVDARGIGSIDITAAERLMMLNDNLRSKNIHFYVTEHVGAVNDELRAFGAERMIEEGAVRRTVALALRAAGVERPYPLEGELNHSNATYVESRERLAEFEWAFGENAEEKMEMLAEQFATQLEETKDFSVEGIEEAEKHTSFGRMGLFDEDELLERLEMHLTHLAQKNPERLRELEEHIQKRRHIIEEKLQKLNPDAVKLLNKHRSELEEHIMQVDPEKYKHLRELHEIK